MTGGRLRNATCDVVSGDTMMGVPGRDQQRQRHGNVAGQNNGVTGRFKVARPGHRGKRNLELSVEDRL